MKMRFCDHDDHQNLISHLLLLPATGDPFRGIFKSSHSTLGLNLAVLTLPSLNLILKDNSKAILYNPLVLS